MKSLLLLWNTIAAQLAVGCCTSVHHDIKTVEVRSKNEGLSFLTITLPSFAKDFERSLELGKVDESAFKSFHKRGRLPAFLSGYSHLVFDRTSGVLLAEPNVDAIQSIRQLTLMFGKILVDCSERRKRLALREFVECEKEVQIRNQGEFSHFHKVSSLLFGSFFTALDRKIHDGELDPKHGPGATADRLVGNQKYVQTTWPCRLDTYFPYGEMVLPNWSFLDQLDEVNFLEPEAEVPVKVTFVPKTMKTPRIIAIEPTAMQYAQQAVLRLVQEEIEGCYLNLFIGLDDQTPNQRLALKGSVSQDLATLDLSEASDRVSHEIVSLLLSSHCHLHDAVMACRSKNALLPGGEVISLAKFASMGSALCFPMEAMVFLTAIFVGIQADLGRYLTSSDIKSYAGRVRVYGDDLIVPVDHVRSVIRSLEYFGLKVNVNKSFWNGKFRESCGKEYYDGKDVSVVRVRRVFPSSRKNVQETLSLVSLRNQLFWVGLEDAVDLLDRQVFRLIGHFPIVEEGSPVLGRHSHLRTDNRTKHRLVNDIPMVKGWLIRPRIPVNEIDGWPALRKCLAALNRRPPGPISLGLRLKADRSIENVGIATPTDHLRRSGRPRVVDIKLGMGPSR